MVVRVLDECMCLYAEYSTQYLVRGLQRLRWQPFAHCAEHVLYDTRYLAQVLELVVEVFVQLLCRDGTGRVGPGRAGPGRVGLGCGLGRRVTAIVTRGRVPGSGLVLLPTLVLYLL